MIDFLLRRRYWAAALLALITMAVLPGVKEAAIPDNALTVWFLDDDPQLQAYRDFQAEFGNDEVILIMVEPPTGLADAATQTKIREFGAAGTKIDGVGRVASFLSLPGVPADSVLSAEQLNLMAQNPMIQGRFLSEDGKKALIWVTMAAIDDFDAQRDRIVAAVRAAADESLGALKPASGGIGVIYSALNLATQRDFGLFIAVTYLLMFGFLWWVLRSWRLVLASIGVVMVGTLVSLGAYGLMGHRMNMVTVLLPTLVIILGIADAIHFPSAFFEAQRQSPESSRWSHVSAAFRHVAPPCVLNTFTTVAAFWGMSAAPMAVVRDLGIYAGIGLLAALAATLVLMALALLALPEQGTKVEHKRILKFLDGVERAVVRRPWQLAALSLVVVGVAALGVLQVETDTYTLGYLPDQSRVVLDHHRLEDRWGHYTPLDIAVQRSDGTAVDTPHMRQLAAEFVERATELPSVSRGFGFYSAVPSSPNLKPDKPPEEKLVSDDGKTGRVLLVGAMMSAVELSDLLDKLNDIAASVFADEATATPRGYPPMYVEIIDYVVRSFTQSFAIALIVIFALLLVFLRSLPLALLSLVPNLFPVVVMFGVMGALGIHLDVATATIAAIVLGVAVDDTVHMLHHWRGCQREGLNWQQSLHKSLRQAGLAATITSLALMIGFPVLMLAEVKTVIYFGLLASVASAAALYGDLVILPLLLRVTSWSTKRGGANG